MSIPTLASNPIGYVGVDFFVDPPFISAQRAPTSNDIYNPGTRWQDNSVSPAVIYETIGGGIWDLGGNAYATTSTAGIVQLSSSIVGDAASLTLVPTVKEIKDYVDAVAILGAPIATTTVFGITELSTDAIAVAGTANVPGVTARVIQPSNLAAVFAAPPAIGGTTPTTAAFTTLAFTTMTGTGGGTWASGGTPILIGADASADAMNFGTAGDRLITIGNNTGATSLVLNVGTGNLDLGVDAIAHTIRIGNAIGATAVSITSGTGSIALASTGTGDITLASSDTVLIDSAGVLELNSSAGIISIGNDVVSQAINIGTGGVRTITIGDITGATGIVMNSGTNGIQMVSTGAGDITIASGDTVLIDSVGVLELNSSAGIISIGNDAVSQNINLGTAGTRAIAIGNSTSTTSVSINGGTGSSVNIGTNAIAHTVTIGNITTTTAVTINTGTGGFNVNTTTTGDIVLNSADTVLIDSAGVLELNSSAGVISIGNDVVSQNINIGTGGVRTITIGDVTGGSATVINSGTGGVAINTTGTGDFIVTSADTVLIDSAGVLELNSSAGVISIGNDVVSQNINIGTGGVRTITIGDVTGGSGTVINSGTGGVAINTTGTGDFIVTSADTVLIDSAGVLELNSSAGVISIGNDAVNQNINLGTAGTRTIAIGSAGATVNVTSGSGNVNVLGGHLSIGTVAKTLLVNGGAVTDFIGTGVLTAGTQTIANTNIAAGDVILLTRTAVNASTTIGVFTYSISAGASFTVTSVIIGTPGSTQTGDVSSYNYFIVRPT